MAWIRTKGKDSNEQGINSISVNNIPQTIDINKNVNIIVPTKTSDLVNDSNFIDNTVNNLTNYYTKTEVDTKISSVYRFKGSVLTYSNLPSSDQEIGDVYNIETADPMHDINAGDNVAWTGSEWDKLGGDIDLSDYYTKNTIDTLLNTKANSATTYTKTEVDTILTNKVDKIDGKGLSTNDYTSAEKTKLAGIATGAEVNVQSDWNIADNASDAFIKNKPTLGTAAAKDVATSGNASNSQVVMGNDSRLTDARTPTSHTHNYAGSSSAGGAATSANKLNTNAGSATQPIYFSNGVPAVTTYALNKTVPSDAVFTDTITGTTYAAGSVPANTTFATNGSVKNVYDALKDLLFPIGAVIESTTCDTMAKVVAAYGGTTWIQHTGYVLRGASSGVVANSATKTGGADSVSYTPASSDGKTGGTALTAANMPYHRHSIPALSGTAASAGNHSHTAGGAVGTAGSQYAAGLYNNQQPASVIPVSSAGAHTHSVTTTASNTGYAGGSNGAATAHTHTFTGKAATINTLPQYKSVYIWERTA